MKPLGVLLSLSLAALGLAIGIVGSRAGAHTAPSVASTALPWRTHVIVDPRPYLATPSPHRSHKPKPHPAPPRRRPLAAPTPETFERHDTSPRPPRIK